MNGNRLWGARRWRASVPLHFFRAATYREREGGRRGVKIYGVASLHWHAASRANRCMYYNECMYALQGVHTRAANCMYRMGVLVLPMQVGSTVHLYYIDSG